MKTYQRNQFFYYRKLVLCLIFCFPLALTANDDCRDFVKAAQKLSRSIEKLEKKSADAKAAVEKAKTAQEQAKKALDSFDHPDDPSEHDSDVVKERKKLARKLEKAEEDFQDAKADYYDALQKLIDELQALKDKLAKADEQCKKELDAAERERKIADLKDWQDELAELRDRHNLEERAGEPEEPENTKKKQEELVEAELKALLEAILKAIREEQEDPEAIRSALRKKKQEIRNDWNDGFWDTPLGKVLKKRLEEALQKAIDHPTGTSPDPEDTPQDNEENSNTPEEEQSFKSFLPEENRRFGLGLSFGLSGRTPLSWCPTNPVTSNQLTHAELGSVLSQVDLGQTGSPIDLSNGAPTTIGSETTGQSAITVPCLEEWSTQPNYGIFLERYLNQHWAIRFGARYWSAFSRITGANESLIGEDGIIHTEMINWEAQVQGLELQGGLIRNFGKGQIRPLLGGQALYQRLNGSIISDEPSVPQEFLLQNDRWGTQALAGVQIQVFSKLGVALLGQWDHYFDQKGSNGTGGLQLQLIWHP